MINDRPRISDDDWRALFWLIAILVIVLAICAVDPTKMAAPR